MGKICITAHKERLSKAAVSKSRNSEESSTECASRCASPPHSIKNFFLANSIIPRASRRERGVLQEPCFRFDSSVRRVVHRHRSHRSCVASRARHSAKRANPSRFWSKACRFSHYCRDPWKINGARNRRTLSRNGDVLERENVSVYRIMPEECKM